MADVNAGNANVAFYQLTQTTTPATGATGKWRFYAKSDGFYIKSPAGTEYKLGAGALPSVDIDGGTIDGVTIGGASAGAGTFNDVTVSATAPELKVDGSTGQNKIIRFRTGTSSRWSLRSNNTAESGTNAGSNFLITSFDDSGVAIANVLTITRSTGNPAFTGTMSKGGGSFDIDHPLDPGNKDLIHSFVEGPRADLIYRGVVQLVSGQATVNIDTAAGMTPGTYEALTKHAEAEFFLQNKTGFGAVRGTLVGGVLTIVCQQGNSTDTISWMVVAERNDPFYLACSLTDDDGNFIVERDKPAPTPEELAQLQPVEGDVEAVVMEPVLDLIGLRGYPRHAHMTGGARPMREVRPRRPGQGNDRGGGRLTEGDLSQPPKLDNPGKRD